MHPPQISDQSGRRFSDTPGMSLQPGIPASVTPENPLADHIPANRAVILVNRGYDFVDFLLLIDLSDFKQRFSPFHFRYLLENLKKHTDGGNVVKTADNIHLSVKGIYVSDSVMSDLFML